MPRKLESYCLVHGDIKGVGKIYQQTVIDTYSNTGFAKVHTEKNALVAAGMLNSKVLPFFDEEQMRVLRVLTDRGSEYCGKQEQHPFELFLHLNDIEHSKTKAYSPPTNGSTEKLNQTIQEEFYKVAVRKTLYYSSLDQIQVDLNVSMRRYSEQTKGRTPKMTADKQFQ